jgi:hypothetical protein
MPLLRGVCTSSRLSVARTRCRFWTNGYSRSCSNCLRRDSYHRHAGPLERAFPILRNRLLLRWLEDGHAGRSEVGRALGPSCLL